MVSPFAPRERALRASDQDRERLAVALKDHAADGRLSVDELDERLGTCYSARTVGELDSLLWDLPSAAAPATLPRRPVRRERGPVRTAVVVLGLVFALLVLPNLLLAAGGLVVALAVLAVGAVFVLVPLAVVVGVIVLVVRAIRAADRPR